MLMWLRLNQLIQCVLSSQKYCILAYFFSFTFFFLVFEVIIYLHVALPFPPFKPSHIFLPISFQIQPFFFHQFYCLKIYIYTHIFLNITTSAYIMLPLCCLLYYKKWEVLHIFCKNSINTDFCLKQKIILETVQLSKYSLLTRSNAILNRDQGTRRVTAVTLDQI